MCVNLGYCVRTWECVCMVLPLLGVSVCVSERFAPFCLSDASSSWIRVKWLGGEDRRDERKRILYSYEKKGSPLHLSSSSSLGNSLILVSVCFRSSSLAWVLLPSPLKKDYHLFQSSSSSFSHCLWIQRHRHCVCLYHTQELICKILFDFPSFRSWMTTREWRE